MRVFVIATLVAAAMLLSYVMPVDASGKNLEITIPNGASVQNELVTFHPEILPFDPHDTITWKNKDNTVHSVTSGIPAHPDYSGIFFKTGDIESSKSSTIGTENLTNFAYYYFCQIHPWMTGKLVLATAPESLPETVNAIVAEKEYRKGTDIVITGTVASDFAKTPYQLLVYQYPDRLVDVLDAKFDDDASYSQTIQTDGLVASKYTVRLVYGLPTQIATKTFELSETSTSIPKWIKNEARWWASGTLPDSEFAKTIEHLAKERILTLQKNDSSASIIPTWFKVNAGWWAEGRITDSEFAKGLQYLVNAGIVQI
ncbi:cupredoxin domain-containing protein [Candidatus Nitrosotenuis uzonensis]|uniref:Blue (type 1) copper domain-containing protein n=1 Tax=Candidatus Nitrosotenuis uzonensis TaxID=1407055 RepID=A0A812EXT8_9ARCH|nr:hypothetical protein [Candidatus Nitrosotenuis uzonensis]CAE6500669.1 conserved exported hypothetical protein [Candidatus Nitrosotenuis uzonensis]